MIRRSLVPPNPTFTPEERQADLQSRAPDLAAAAPAERTPEQIAAEGEEFLRNRKTAAEAAAAAAIAPLDRPADAAPAIGSEPAAGSLSTAAPATKYEPLPAKERRQLFKDAEAAIDAKDPIDQVSLRERFDRMKRRHDEARRELDEATTPGDRRRAELDMMDDENAIRRLVGMPEVETQAPITEGDQRKEAARQKAVLDELDAKIARGEPLTDEDRKAWVTEGRKKADIPTNEKTPPSPEPAAPPAAPAAETAAPAAPVPAAVTPQAGEPAATAPLTYKQAKDFAETGNYDVETGDGVRQMFRDRENGYWHDASKIGSQFGYFESVLGFNKKEALEAMEARYGRPEATAAEKPKAKTKAKAPKAPAPAAPAPDVDPVTGIEILPSERANEADIRLGISQGRNYFTLWFKQTGRDANGKAQTANYQYLTILSKDLDEARAKAAEYAKQIASGTKLPVAFFGRGLQGAGSAKSVAVGEDLIDPTQLEEIDRTPIADQPVGFGKYSNMLVKDILTEDPGYAEWIIGSGTSRRALDIAAYLKSRPEWMEMQDERELESERIKAYEQRRDARAAGEKVSVTTMVRKDGEIVEVDEDTAPPPKVKKLKSRKAKDQILDIVAPQETQNLVAEELVKHLYPMQLVGANAAIASMEKDGVFLNGDGAGVGKTRQIVAVANHYAKQGKRVFIISENAAIGKPWEKVSKKTGPKLAGSMSKDSEAMGVKLELLGEVEQQDGGIYVTNYSRVKAGDIPDGAVLIFDEAQNLANTFGSNPDPKNTAEREWEAKFKQMLPRATAVAYYSATPADKPHQLAYLHKILGYDTPGEYLAAAQENGMVLKTRKFGNKEVQYYDVPQGAKRKKLFDWVNQTMLDAGAEGRFIKREISYEGTDVQFQDLSGTDEGKNPWAKYFNDVLAQMKETENLGTGIRIMAPESYVLYAAELTKIGKAVEMAKKEIAAGRKAVVFFSRIKPMVMRYRRYTRDRDGEMQVSEPIEFGSIPSPVDLIKAELEKEGITFTELHGATRTTSQKAQKEFAEKVDVLLASLESGGTGINLDDTTGSNPRTEIFMFAPYRGTSTIQGMGRIWRASTIQDDNNPNRFAMIVASDIKPDVFRSAVLAKKLQLMGAAMGGTAVAKMPMSKTSYDPKQLAGLEMSEDGEESALTKPRTGKLKPVTVQWKPTKAGEYYSKASADLLEWEERGGPERTGLEIRVFKSRDSGDWIALADRPYTAEEFALPEEIEPTPPPAPPTAPAPEPTPPSTKRDVIKLRPTDPKVTAAAEAIREELGEPAFEDANSEVLTPEGVLIDVRAFGDNIILSNISTPEGSRGTGAASRAVDTILEGADRAGVPVKLIAKPFGDAGLSKKQLIAWYSAKGFELQPDGETMVRQPQQVAAPTPTPEPKAKSARPKPYSPAAIEEAFDSTPEQAVAMDALMRAVGIPFTPVNLMRGGTPGDGSLEQSSARDAEYRAAVEAGDIAKAQAMVDEAARAAGYTWRMYHNGAPGVTEFDPGARRAGARSNIDAIGTWFTADKNQAERKVFGSSVYSAHLNLQNPLILTWDGAGKEAVAGSLRWVRRMGQMDLSGLPESEYRRIQERAKWIEEGDPRNQLSKIWLAANGDRKSIDGFDDFSGDAAAFVEEIKRQGYDGIIMESTVADSAMFGDLAADWAVAFDPNQIKSADPVTRDADGNVIPLSRRFDTSSPSILYQDGAIDEGQFEDDDSYSPTDNDGDQEAIPLEMRVDEDGNPILNPQGKPRVRTVSYDLLTAPMVTTFQGSPEDSTKPDTTKLHYTVTGPSRERLSAAIDSGAADHAVGRLVEETRRMLQNPDVAAGKGWYSRMRQKLLAAFGPEDARMFSHLLGTTSAKTPVENNFVYAVDLMRRYKRGEFTRHIRLYQEMVLLDRSKKLGDVMAARGILSKKDQAVVPKGQLRDTLRSLWIAHYDILPVQTNGKLFGSNSLPALKAMSEMWLVGKVTPKTPQFAMNLNGDSVQATIDVWAARLLRRILYAKQGQPWRIQPKAEEAVSNEDFAFAQEVFRRAAAKLEMNPDDLQAIVWFGEKQIWDESGWTAEVGAFKSSFDEVFDVFFPEGRSPRDYETGRRIVSFLQAERLYLADKATKKEFEKQVETAKTPEQLKAVRRQTITRRKHELEYRIRKDARGVPAYLADRRRKALSESGAGRPQGAPAADERGRAGGETREANPRPTGRGPLAEGTGPAAAGDAQTLSPGGPNVLFQGGDSGAPKGRTPRNPIVQQAAQDFKEGKISREEYNLVVDLNMPLRSFGRALTPATPEEVLRGLGNRPARKGVLKSALAKKPEDIPDGKPLAARLDIPAYEDENVWVVSLHLPGKTGDIYGYTPTSVLTNVTFNVNEPAALGVATGRAKASFARMDGTYVAMSAEEAQRLAEKALTEGWVEIGMNPIRHSYFYDKAGQRPVKSAEQVVQVGALVLAKNPVYGNSADYLFQFAGESANTPQFMRDSLDTAKAMAAAGKSSAEIRAVTGWFPGKYDGKMRWEIPDNEATLRLDAFRAARLKGESAQDIARNHFARKQEAEMDAAMEKSFELDGPALLEFSRNFEARKRAENVGLNTFFLNEQNRDRGRVPLAYLLDHPALFEAYPDLKWMPVSFSANDIGSDATVLGAYNPNFEGIALNPLVAYDDSIGAISTLLHETQHAIQQREGFAKGSSASQFAGPNMSAMLGKSRYIDFLKPTLDLLDRIGPITDEKIERMTEAEKSTVTPAWDERNDRWMTADEVRAKIARLQEEMANTDFDGTESYRRTAGEIEARDVEARRTMTPEQRAAVEPYSSENISTEAANILFQRPQTAKGSFEYIKETGDILLRGLASPDFSTAVHEFAHVIRRTLIDRDIPAENRAGISDEDIRLAEDWAGATNGVWTVAAEEKFARAWERYLREGKAPVSVLQPLFDKMAAWLSEVYSTIAGSPIDVEISPEMRAVFNRLASRNVDQDAEVEMDMDEAAPPLSDQEFADRVADVEKSVSEGQPPNIPPVTPPTPPPGVEEDPFADHVSNMHRFIDEGRARRGLAPLMKRPRVANEDAWQAALSAERAHRAAGKPGTAGNELFAKLLLDPVRALAPWETALLMHEHALREGAHDAANYNLNSLPAGSPLRDEYRATKTREQEAYDALTTFLRAAGSASGSSLQALKMVIDTRDFTLARVTNEWHAAANAMSDTPVKWTEADQTAAEAWYNKYEALKTREAELIAENEGYAALLKQLTEDVERAQAKAAAAARVPAVKAKIMGKLTPAADAARARIAARKAAKEGPPGPDILRQSGPPPEMIEDLQDYAILLAEKMVNGVFDLAKASQIIVSEFGENLSEFAEWIHTDAKRIYNETVESVSGEGAPTPQNIIDAIDVNEELTKKDVWDLARAHVIQGARGSDVLDKVHEGFNEIFPDLTRERVADLFTDYGQTSTPSAEEVPKALRRVKTLERIGRQIDDIKAKREPKVTGRTGDPLDPNDPIDKKILALEEERRSEFRALQEWMRENNVPFEDSERKLKTALGSVKRRMLNDIAKIEQALTTGRARAKKQRVNFENDPEYLDLQKRLKAKRAEYDEVFKTEPDRLQMMKDSASKSLDRYLQMLVTGNTAVAAKPPGPTDPELEELRSLRNTFAKQVAEARRVRPTADEVAKKKRDAALASAEKTLAELERKITENDLAAKTKGAPRFKDDTEIKAVQAKIKAARETLKDMRKAAMPVKDPVQAKIDAVLKSLDRQIAEEAKMLADGVLKKAKGQPVSTPDIEVRRERLRQMRQNRRDLYEAQNPDEIEARALEAAKKDAQTAIERLGEAVVSGDVAVKKRDPAYTPDDELRALIKCRETLSDMVSEMRRALPVTPDQLAAREKRMLAAAEATLANLDAKLATGDLSVKPSKGAANVPASVAAVREKIKRASRQLDVRRREAAVGPYSEAALIQRRLGVLRKKLADRRRRIQTDDYSKKKVPLPPSSPEITQIEYELEKQDAIFYERRGQYMLRNAPKGRRAVQALKTVASGQKFLVLGGDWGILLRNALDATSLTAANDVLLGIKKLAGRADPAAKSQMRRMITKGVRAAFSPKFESETYRRQTTRANARWDDVLGTKIIAPYDKANRGSEDLPVSNLIEKVPWWVWPIVAGVNIGLIYSSPLIAGIVGMSMMKSAFIFGASLIQKPLLQAVDRFQRTYVNEARVLLMDTFIDNYVGGMDVEDGRAYAHFVNVATGRGGARKGRDGVLMTIERMMPGLNAGFLAPRYYLARILSLFAQPLWSGPMTPQTRKAIAYNYGKAKVMQGAILTLLIMAFGKANDDDPEDTGVVLNPYSRDFLKIRISPKVVVDVMGGFNQWMGFFLRRATGTVQNRETGLVEVMTPDEKGRDIRNFVGGKMNPLLRYSTETFFIGEYFGGKPVMPMTMLQEATSMVVIDDMIKVQENTDPKTAAALSVLLLSGGNVKAGDWETEVAKWKPLRDIAEIRRLERESRLNK
jgi:hypothetical protein